MLKLICSLIAACFIGVVLSSVYGTLAATNILGALLGVLAVVVVFNFDYLSGE